MTDPIADLLTRIRNGQMARKTSVFIPASKLKTEILEALKKSGFVLDYKKDVQDNHPVIRIDLDSTKQLTLTKRSKPGQRVYIPKDGIKKVMNGYGISLISTSKGILTGDEARKAGVGGELICEIY